MFTVCSSCVQFVFNLCSVRAKFVSSGNKCLMELFPSRVLSCVACVQSMLFLFSFIVYALFPVNVCSQCAREDSVKCIVCNPFEM